MKKLVFNLKVSKIIYFLIVLLNLFLPLYPGKIVNANVFQFAIMVIWLYGILCQHGYFKRQVSRNEDGKIRYEWNIPIVPIGLTRIAQIAYYLIREVNFSIPIFVAFVVIDVLYVAFMLMDNYTYYYESEID